jgi:hypothetical protein
MKPRIARSVSHGEKQWVAWFNLRKPTGEVKYTGYGVTPKAAYCAVMYWATIQKRT